MIFTLLEDVREASPLRSSRPHGAKEVFVSSGHDCDEQDEIIQSEPPSSDGRSSSGGSTGPESSAEGGWD